MVNRSENRVAGGELPGFAPERATFTTIVVPCTAVVDLLPVSHAPDRIATYRDQMQRGDRFPPVSVIRLAGRYLLADGHKRFGAYQALGQQTIVVEVWPLRQWLRDQRRQAAGNARKTARIFALIGSDPSEAWRLLFTTLQHWRRVAACLLLRALGRVR